MQNMVKKMDNQCVRGNQKTDMNIYYARRLKTDQL